MDSGLDRDLAMLQYVARRPPMRDHTRLRAFHLADTLVMSVYEQTRTFPPDERFGLTAQTRRAAVSVAANIVEGCARRGEPEYLRFLEVAYASARELQYEVSVCCRLGYLGESAAANLERQCTDTAKSLGALLRALRQ